MMDVYIRPLPSIEFRKNITHFTENWHGYNGLAINFLLGLRIPAGVGQTPIARGYSDH